MGACFKGRRDPKLKKPQVKTVVDMYYGLLLRFLLTGAISEGWQRVETSSP